MAFSVTAVLVSPHFDSLCFDFDDNILGDPGGCVGSGGVCGEGWGFHICYWSFGVLPVP